MLHHPTCCPQLLLPLLLPSAFPSLLSALWIRDALVWDTAKTCTECVIVGEELLSRLVSLLRKHTGKFSFFLLIFWVGGYFALQCFLTKIKEVSLASTSLSSSSFLFLPLHPDSNLWQDIISSPLLLNFKYRGRWCSACAQDLRTDIGLGWGTV